MRPATLGLAITIMIGGSSTAVAQESYDSQAETTPRMAASEVAATARLPAGFQMQVAASEPLVQQPIALSWDLKGRLWVAENHTYAESAKGFDLDLSDRIVILEDTDRDGTFDKRTVFYDKLKELTSIEVVQGGVFALASPDLVFLADSNQDDIPDSPPWPLVQGFNTKIRHNFANGLRFGPDGWLYGRHGILGHSDVSIPIRGKGEVGGSTQVAPPAESRNSISGPLNPGANSQPTTTRLTCGIWRYHPQREVIEMVCEGTTNPWGMDWNSHGNLFFINTVIGHLWHAIPGAHLQRMYGEDSDPYAYELLPQIADHVHWDAKGEDWRATRNGPPSSGTDQAGGGHAHSGTMIYQADNWPSEYRDHLFTLNLHGRRINRERLDRFGAGFVGKHEPDMVFWTDPWFRGIDLSTGPDGSVYVLDWSDIGECHDDDGVHRSSGRIYRITHGKTNPDDTLRKDLLSATRIRGRQSTGGMKQDKVMEVLQHPNIWYARELWKSLAFRRISIEGGEEIFETALRPAGKRTSVSGGIDPVALQLRAIWTLHAAGALNEEHIFRLLRTSQHESVHLWAIQLLADQYHFLKHAKQSEGEAEVVDLLASKPITQISPLVRLYVAALLPKFRHQHWRLAGMLIKSEDLANDRDFPLVFWYGTKDMVANDPIRAAKLAVDSKMPKVTELYLRRFASGVIDGEEALSFLIANIASRDNRDLHAAAARGLWQAYQGRRNVKTPASWPKLAERITDHPNVEIRETGLLLTGLFEGEFALDGLIALANNESASPASRRSAIGSLGTIEDDTARAALWKLVSDPFLGGAAAESLGSTLRVEEASRMVEMYSSVWPPGKAGIVIALGSRRDTLPILLDAIEGKRIPVENIDASTWRQFASVADWGLLNRARAIYPALEVTKDLGENIKTWEQKYNEERLASADASRGRTQWNSLCSQCHKLFGEGGAIGPELTGGQRNNLRYWLENILAPSNVVAESYRVTAFLTEDSRVITGVPIAETGREVTIQTAREKVVLSRSEIEQRRPSELSLMPDGILEPLDENARADLLKYLMSPAQVPAK